MRKRLVAAATLLCAPAICSAGGTLGTEQVDALLQQWPTVRAFLTASLEMEDSAFAEIRLGSHFKHLGAWRLGPYTVRARPRSPAAGASPIRVVVCTEARFIDEAGKVIKEDSDALFDAARVEETLTAVMIEEDNYAPPVCPPRASR